MTAAAEVAETPSAALFFVGDRAYKRKKPVDQKEADRSAGVAATSSRWDANTEASSWGTLTTRQPRS